MSIWQVAKVGTRNIHMALQHCISIHHHAVLPSCLSNESQQQWVDNISNTQATPKAKYRWKGGVMTTRQLLSTYRRPSDLGRQRDSLQSSSKRRVHRCISEVYRGLIQTWLTKNLLCVIHHTFISSPNQPAEPHIAVPDSIQLQASDPDAGIGEPAGCQHPGASNLLLRAHQSPHPYNSWYRFEGHRWVSTTPRRYAALI